MSEIKLNLADAERVLCGTIHGSVADSCVAALSAEPETICELERALARYIKPSDSSRHFAWFRETRLLTNGNSSEEWGSISDFRSALDPEPWDAGLVIIDLAARIVACDSLYSQPGPEGEVFYHDGQALTEVPILYRVPGDWLFVNSVDAYIWSRERRMRERAARPAFDARPILFGRPLLQFIVNACLWLPAETWNAFNSSAAENTAEWTSRNAWAKVISTIHARWLLTPRTDLHGQSPRDVLLARQSQIDFDLYTRSLQWSLQNEGPPCLDVNSYAYRFAGFGTHEWVLYYDLMRHLIFNLLELRAAATLSTNGDRLRSDQLIATLERLKTGWLENPQPDLDGRIPAVLIDNERKRLPEAMRPCDIIVDDDCPVCQAFADETTPLGMGVGFWHLDGSHMDDEFAFSSFTTRPEWEAEYRRRELFSREFSQQRAESQQRLASDETPDFDPFFEPEAFDFEPG